MLKTVLAIVVALALVIPNLSIESAFSQSQAKHTIFVYMVGSNLESDGGAASTDINEMLDGGISNDVNLVLLTGGANTDDFAQVKVRQVTSDGLVELVNWGSYDMGDPELLRYFLVTGIDAFPADKYSLLFWNHGAGVQGFGADEMYGDDNLDLTELVSALDAAKQETGVTFEVIGFDACLMATAEVAYNLRGYGNYLVSSEEIEPGHGWDWSSIVSAISKNPALTGVDIGMVIADSYQAHAIQNSYDNQQDAITLSVIDLSKIDDVVAELDNLADQISYFDSDGRQLLAVSSARVYAEEYGKDEARQSYFDMVDMIDFLALLAGYQPELESQIGSLVDTIDEAVVYSVKGDARPYSSGLSIYLPFNGAYYEGYDSIEFSNSWKDFISNYRQAMAQDTSAPVFENEGLEGNQLGAEVISQDVVQNYVSISRYDDETGRQQLLGQYPVGLDENGDLDFEWDSSWFVLCNEQDCSEASFYIDWISDTQLSIDVPAVVNGMDANLMYVFDINGDEIEFIGYWPGTEDTGAQKEILSLYEGDIVNTLMLEYDPSIDDFVYTEDGYDVVVDSEFGVYYMTLPMGEYYATFVSQDAAGNIGVSDTILVESTGSDTYTDAEYAIDEEPIGLAEDEYYYSAPSEDDTGEFLSEIEGKYVDQDAGLEIQLPDGWKGINFFGIIMAAPGDLDLQSESPKAMMVVMTLNRTAIADMASSMDYDELTAPEETGMAEKDCSESSASYTMVNEMNALHVAQECTTPEYAKMDVYGFATSSSLVLVMYSANSAELYDQHADEFEQSINSMVLQNPENFRDAASQIMNLEPVSYEAQVEGKPVDLYMETNSKITQFEFDEQSKQVSFQVEGQDGTQGSTSVVIDSLLEGPYMVTIDGNPTEDYIVVKDSVNDQTVLVVNHGDSSHQIAITGTQVVPEFPIVLLVLVMTLGGIIVTTRHWRNPMFGL